jgi:hypothetical protein
MATSERLSPGRPVEASHARVQKTGRSGTRRVTDGPSRRVHHGPWDKIEQGSDTVQARFDGAGTREVEEDAVLGLLALGGHFDEGEEQGGGLRLGSRGMVQGLRAQGMMQDRGGTGQEELHGLDQKGLSRGAVAVESTLACLDIVFPIPTRAVEFLLHPRWRRGHQGGNPKAGGYRRLPSLRL